MSRHEYIITIIKLLSRLPSLVESNNKLFLTDVNNFSEGFYEELLNLVYGYQLVNLNKFNQNAVAIDLGDFKNRISVQVTSTSSFKKTKTTFEKFIKNKLYNEYDRLIIFNIVGKSVHKVKEMVDSNFKFDTIKDIWDINSVLKDIKHLPSIDHIKKIYDFLIKELSDKPIKNLSNEVNTILGIIGILSEKGNSEAGKGFLEDPDPNNKILKRFSDHSQFLKDRYYELYIEYGKILQTIYDENDLGSQELRRSGMYLKGFSDEVLNSCNGNPKEALVKLVENFKSLLSENGFEFDANAAEFYVVEQLIRCNVFPNRIII